MYKFKRVTIGCPQIILTGGAQNPPALSTIDMKSRKVSLFHRSPTTTLAAVALVMSTSAHAQTSIWDGGSTTSNSWGAADNWNPNTAPTFNTTRDLTFNNLTRPANDIGGARTIRSISYGANMDSDFLTNFRSFDGGAAAALTLQANSGNATITVDGGATGNMNLGWGGIGTAGGSLILGSNLDIVHNGSGNLTFSRNITGTSFGITKTGTGTMIVSNFAGNTFTGAASFNGGRAIFGNTNSATGDLNTASAVNFDGGILEIRTSTAFNKTLTSNTTVSSASTLVYNNTAATDQSFTISTGSMTLNANLTVQNISSSTAGNNIINLTRNLTGSGNLIVDTYNNVSSGASSLSNGRVQLSGDNTGWTGNLVIAKGSAQLSGNNSFVPAAGSITLGTTGNAFGAALGFNQLATDANVSNDLTVTTGGIRLIRNNAGPGSSNNITLGGDIDLQGTLTLDHAGLGTGKSITVSGNVSGAGGLNVTFVGPNPDSTSSVRLTGTNSYTGATNVNSGTLVINSNISTSSLTTVALGATLGGSGTVGKATINGTLAVGNSPGQMNFTDTLGLNGTVVMEIDGIAGAGIASGHDFINLTGAGAAGVLTYGGTMTLDIGTIFSAGSYTWNLFDMTSETGTFATITLADQYSGSLLDGDSNGIWDLTAGSNTWQFTESTGVLGLTVVPEPQAALLGGLGLLVMLRRRRA